MLSIRYATLTSVMEECNLITPHMSRYTISSIMYIIEVLRGVFLLFFFFELVGFSSPRAGAHINR